MKKLIPNKAKLIPENAKRVFRGEIFEVYQWDQEMFDGSIAVFEMLKRADTVEVIAIENGEILLLDDEQPDRGSWMSLPGGRCDDTDLTPLEAAKRELLEETGYTFKNWKLIKCTQPEAKIERFVYVFVATDVEAIVDKKEDAGERISVGKVHLEELKQLAEAGDEPHLRHLYPLLMQLNYVKELVDFPEFKGIDVDR